MKRKSKEEKARLIKEFKESGLSMTKWCNANNIPPSTLAGWIYGKKTKGSKTKNKTKFIEVIEPLVSTPQSTSPIIIEYKNFKISVSESIDFKTLENTLKVVTQFNV